MKTKVLKPTIDKAVKAKEKLLKDADKVIERLQKSGLKQDFIAENTNLSSATLSRFMNKKDGYVTNSMISRLTVFLNDHGK
ncbi:MAG TPA: hypothetical protein VD905_06250 [Flavobacteriales bacterium]|nr:hypothetical protein [Flavobacteriales bacterium]